MLHSRVAAFFETCSAFGHEVRQNGTECRLRVRFERLLECELAWRRTMSTSRAPAHEPGLN
jgi:hypothetical protein